MDQQVRAVTLGGSRVQKVRDIDFRRPMKFTREQLRVLERAHDGFCRSASNRMSAEMRSEIVLRFLASDQLPYSVVIGEELPQQAFMLILEAEPIGTRFALVVEIQTILSLVSRSLGGTIRDTATDDEMSELELAVGKRALEGLIESLSDTWTDLCGVSFRQAEVENSPAAIQLVPPSEPTLLLSFSAQLEEQVSLITLIAPWRSIDPVLETIVAAQQEFVEEITQSGTMGRVLGRVGVELCAEVGSTNMQIGDLLSYKPGDTIVFPQNAESGVEVLIDGAPIYQGQPGTHESQRAVQIQKVFEQK